MRMFRPTFLLVFVDGLLASRLARAEDKITVFAAASLKNALDGAAEGARFIADHIIRVGDRPFDAGMRTAPKTTMLERMLGLKG